MPGRCVLSDDSQIVPADIDAFIRWRLGAPLGEESCRWNCVDGRWVSLALGQDAEVGFVVVADSSGRRSLISSYEEALALARSWRTDDN